MAAETGHAPNRAYHDQKGNLHLNGAQMFDSNEAVVPARATFSPAQGAANVSLVTIQVVDDAGNAVAFPVTMDVLLSDASTGAGLTAVTASGAVAAGASGTDLSAMVAKKAIRVQTDATGKYILSITDTAKTGFYVVAALGGRAPSVSSQLVAGNYG